MPKAPNKLYSRAQVRTELRKIAEDIAATLIKHRAECAEDISHKAANCEVCSGWRREICGVGLAIRHFGGITSGQ